MNIVYSTDSTGINGFEVGQRVIVSDDPFGKYVVESITRAGRVIVKGENGKTRSLTATACMHPVRIEGKKKGKKVCLYS